MFSKPNHPLSNKILDSLPDRVKTELRAIVGKTPEFGESQIHGFRRIRLYEVEQNMRTNTLEEVIPDIDYENAKINKEGVIIPFAATKRVKSETFVRPSQIVLIQSLTDYSHY